MTRSAAFYAPGAADLDAFKALTAQRLDPGQVPLAARVEKNIPLYDMAALRPVLDDPARRQALQGEWVWVLGQGPGIIALQCACADLSVIDRATQMFNRIIAEEKAKGAGQGDHFAASGANDRVWNSLQKHCLSDPEGFALYFGNTAIAAACEAWLGPHYQMTAQVNQVRPGGKAQKAHRDYHLGFQSADQAARFPVHAHHLSASLTLQGAVAHCDMPLASGPTKLLPFSQLYGPGYLAYHDPAHRDHFEAAHVQLALQKGDVLFFNPAVFHAAGDNVSAEIHRMANLLQVSSAFGRATEAVNRRAMCGALYPALLRLKQAGEMGAADLAAAVAACAEGYAFPTNLDTDPPVGGIAPESQADIMRRALETDRPGPDFEADLAALAARQIA